MYPARPLPHRVSYCTTCKGRLHHLKQTLPVNLAAEAGNPNVEFVILDYGSEDGLGEWIHANYQPEIESGRIRYARSEQPHFRMAHAKNMAHRVATGDILCNLDADNVIAPDFSKYLVEQFSRNPHSVVSVHPLTVSEKRKKAEPLVVDGKRMRIGDGFGGRLAISSQDFYRIGGYDERHVGWGMDDVNFALRARDAGLEPVRIPRGLYGNVIKHDNVDRLTELSQEGRQQSQEHMRPKGKFRANAAEYLRLIRSYTPVVNTEGFGMGDVDINGRHTQHLGKKILPSPTTPEQTPPSSNRWREQALTRQAERSRGHSPS